MSISIEFIDHRESSFAPLEANWFVKKTAIKQKRKKKRNVCLQGQILPPNHLNVLQTVQLMFCDATSFLVHENTMLCLFSSSFYLALLKLHFVLVIIFQYRFFLPFFRLSFEIGLEIERTSHAISSNCISRFISFTIIRISDMCTVKLFSPSSFLSFFAFPVSRCHR